MTTTQYIRNTVTIQDATLQSSHNVTPFRYVLICDVETTTDFSQRLRLSGYCLYDMETGTIKEKGITTGLLSETERDTIMQYAGTHGLRVMTHNQFITYRLYPLLQHQTALVNHNIVFDLGAMATSWVGVGKTFYLKLCTCPLPDEKIFVCPNHPPIAVRSLNFPKALIYIASNQPYAPILDTMTIGRALLGPGDMSLKGMGLRFKCETVKQISEEHGTELTDSYLDYTMRDVQATLELFLAEVREYNRHGLDAPISSILSEASIGKAYLRKLRVPAFYQQHKALPGWLNSIAISAYYGARSEVRLRLQPSEIRYCDFKSQYPTVNALLGLQELLLAEHITVQHTTAGTQQFINQVTLDDLQRPDTWKKLRTLVKLAPNGDIVPNKFSTVDQDTGDKVTGYAVCYTSSDTPTWYALSDIVASKLLTGTAPRILDAVTLYPHGQVPTAPLTLFNDTRYSIDLRKQDFFTEVINLRTSVKRDLKTAKTSGDVDQVGYLDSLQLALKLLANSTSYGVLVETRYDEGTEIAGTFYASPVAVHITAAARLLLAIAETLGRQRGLQYAMCDTDSMAYARPSDMDRDTFYRLVDQVVNWFTPLSPYAPNDDGSIPALFELEDVNEYQGIDTPLYFLGVSCKRYVLYNKLDNGTYRIRKLSAHATGRYSFDKELPLPGDVPAPTGNYKLWQYLLWYRAIEQSEKGVTDISIPLEQWSSNIARYQESISTPGKATMYRYIPGIRPYSFFTAFPISPRAVHRYIMPGVFTHADILATDAYRAGSMTKDNPPYYDTLADRFTGFFSHAEDKAANGHETGYLDRRHIQVTDIVSRTRSGKTVQPEQKKPAKDATLWDSLA